MVLRSVRARWCGLLFALALASAFDSRAGDIALLSATQTKPGEVSVRIDHSGEPAPTAGQFSLRLSPDVTLTAELVTPSTAASTALLLCLDRSGSMGPATIAAMQSALRQSLLPARATGALPLRLAIVAFGTRSTHLLSPTTDRALAADAIAKFTPEREREGKTRLHDAVAGGLAELRAIDASSKRLLVVSDGNDEGSDLAQAVVLQRANTAPSVVVDAIGFGPQAAAASGSLATLAEATGGRFTVANNQRELVAALERTVKQAATAPQVDVLFSYTAASGDGKAAAPVLVFKPRTGAAQELKITTGLAAAAPVAVASAPLAAPVASAASTPSNLTNWQAILHWFTSLPVLAWAAIAVLVALVLAVLIALFVRRRAEPPVVLPEPIQPVTVIPPRGPTQVPAPPPPEPRGHNPTVVSFRWPRPGQGTVVAILRVASGASKGKRYEIAAAKARIGSDADNEIVLKDDDFVSGHHAVLRAEADALYVVDLGSTNGCDLNGRRFKDSTRSLSPDDRLTVGRTVFEVLAPTPARGPQSSDQRMR
ncbi:MAG: von Willebrand factor type domain/FHA domain [Rhizobacter sp.]|nr:von Willebrand factor type domain/FHA domain [Rhizobacter sp.]